MYDGSLKKVEDVAVGDLLMGDDSTPRKVHSLARGRERMFWIRQNKGKDYRVNESHILSLKKSRQEGTGERGDILDISVKDYISRSSKFQTNYKGYKVAVDFPEQKVPLPPYFLGLWLGDGSSGKSNIHTQDEEVVAYLQELANRFSLTLTSYLVPGKCPEYRISNEAKRWGYSLQGELREMGVLGNKHIPRGYLINSRKNRLLLLAGLLDSDGHYLEQSNGYEITQKDEALTRQIKFLCDSLGYRVSFKAKRASIASTGFESTVYRLRIYGNIDEIPVRIERKQAREWRSPVDWQVTGIQVEFDKVDDYYGFEIDGNRRFLLEDMTVTHNTALTLSLAKNAASDFGKPVAIFSLEMSALQLAQRVISMEAEISGMKMRNGQLEEYEWQQLNAALERISEVPLFIDDTPGINIFELRAKARRLKMQHDIDLIIIDYLQLMSGGGDSQRGNREQEVSAISRALKGLAKELSVPVIALSQLSRAVEVRGGTKRPQLSDLRESGCLTGDTLLQDAETGRLVSIKTLAEREEQKPIKVVALGDDQKLSSHTMVKAFYSGRKMIFELKTRSGRRIKASSNHPFLKLEGWTALEALKIGDKIAIPREIPIEKPDNPLSEDELILLAHLIGDGCILPKQPYHYTSADMANIEVVNEKADKLFGIKGRIVEQKNWWHTYLKSPTQLTHRRKNPITKWYESMGLDRVRSYAKRLPNGVFRCDNQRLALFLHHLWATDGNVSWKKLKGRKPSAAIYYATSSPTLASQVQHLLCRLGIQSAIRLVSQGKHRDNYHVLVQGTTNQLRFLRKIGCYGSRGNCIPELIQALEAIKINPNNGVIPKEAWRMLIEPIMKKQGISWRGLFRAMELQYSSSIYKNGISRERLKRINAILKGNNLKDLANSDIYWDEIVELNPLGEEDVFDATVEGVHNFLANDIIVHNSIEQDADIVAFIYRPEYYDILEDEEGQSLKGIAEVIVAKHRHGALKTIKLRFTDEFARFSDLDDPDFGALPEDTFESPQSNIITRPSKMNDDEDIPF
ncbi:MAG: replicative DNA helicase [Phaeodactylibacter sp.]|nr:replicative DNA helicase [Phaeodactylibacter sp.]